MTTLKEQLAATRGIKNVNTDKFLREYRANLQWNKLQTWESWTYVKNLDEDFKDCESLFKSCWHDSVDNALHLDNLRVSESPAYETREIPFLNPQQLTQLDNAIQLFMDLSIPYLLQPQVQRLVDYLIYRYDLADRYGELVLFNSLVYHYTPYFVMILSLLKLDPNSAANVYKINVVEPERGIDRTVVLRATNKSFSNYKKLCETAKRLVLLRKREGNNGAYISLYNVACMSYIQDADKSLEDHQVTFIVNNFLQALEHPEYSKYHNANICSLCLLASRVTLAVPVQLTVVTAVLQPVLEKVLSASKLTIPLKAAFRDSLMVVLLLLQHQKVRFGYLSVEVLKLMLDVMSKHGSLATFLEIETKGKMLDNSRFCRLVFTTLLKYARTLMANRDTEALIKVNVDSFLSFFARMKISSHYMRFILLAVIDELYILANSARNHGEALFKVHRDVNSASVNSKHESACLFFKHVLLYIQVSHPEVLEDTLARHIVNVTGPGGSVDVFLFVCYCLADTNNAKFLLYVHKHLNRTIDVTAAVPERVEIANILPTIGLFLEPLTTPQLRDQLFGLIADAFTGDDVIDWSKRDNSWPIVAEFFTTSLKNKTFAVTLYSTLKLWSVLPIDVACNCICDHIADLFLELDRRIDTRNLASGTSVITSGSGFNVNIDPYVEAFGNAIMREHEDLGKALDCFCELYYIADEVLRKSMEDKSHFMLFTLVQVRETLEKASNPWLSRCCKLLSNPRTIAKQDAMNYGFRLIQVLMKMYDAFKVSKEQLSLDNETQIALDTTISYPLGGRLWWNCFSVNILLHSLLGAFTNERDIDSYEFGVLTASLLLQVGKQGSGSLEASLVFLKDYMVALTRSIALVTPPRNHSVVLEHLHIILSHEELVSDFTSELKHYAKFWLPYIFELSRCYYDHQVTATSGSAYATIVYEKQKCIIVCDKNDSLDGAVASFNAILQDTFTRICAPQLYESIALSDGSVSGGGIHSLLVPLVVFDVDPSVLFSRCLDVLNCGCQVLIASQELHVLDVALHLLRYITSLVLKVPLLTAKVVANVVEASKGRRIALCRPTQCSLNVVNLFDSVDLKGQFDSAAKPMESFAKAKGADLVSRFVTALQGDHNLGWPLFLYAITCGSDAIFESSVYESLLNNPKIWKGDNIRVICVVLRRLLDKHRHDDIKVSYKASLLFSLLLTMLYRANVATRDIFGSDAIVLIQVCEQYLEVCSGPCIKSETEAYGQTYAARHWVRLNLKNSTNLLLYMLKDGCFWTWDDSTKLKVVKAISGYLASMGLSLQHFLANCIFALPSGIQKSCVPFLKLLYSADFDSGFVQVIVECIVVRIDSLQTLKKVFDITNDSKRLSPATIIKLNTCILLKLILGTSISNDRVQAFISSSIPSLVQVGCQHMEKGVEICFGQIFNLLYQTLYSLSLEQKYFRDTSVCAFEGFSKIFAKLCDTHNADLVAFMKPVLQNLVMVSRGLDEQFQLCSILDLYSEPSLDAVACQELLNSFSVFSRDADLGDEWLAACIVKCSPLLQNNTLLYKTALDLVATSSNVPKVVARLTWSMLQETDANIARLATRALEFAKFPGRVGGASRDTGRSFDVLFQFVSDVIDVHTEKFVFQLNSDFFHNTRSANYLAFKDTLLLLQSLVLLMVAIKHQNESVGALKRRKLTNGKCHDTSHHKVPGLISRLFALNAPLHNHQLALGCLEILERVDFGDLEPLYLQIVLQHACVVTGSTSGFAKTKQRFTNEFADITARLYKVLLGYLTCEAAGAGFEKSTSAIWSFVYRDDFEVSGAIDHCCEAIVYGLDMQWPIANSRKYRDVLYANLVLYKVVTRGIGLIKADSLVRICDSMAKNLKELVNNKSTASLTNVLLFGCLTLSSVGDGYISGVSAKQLAVALANLICNINVPLQGPEFSFSLGGDVKKSKAIEAKYVEVCNAIVNSSIDRLVRAMMSDDGESSKAITLDIVTMLAVQVARISKPRHLIKILLSYHDNNNASSPTCVIGAIRLLKILGINLGLTTEIQKKHTEKLGNIYLLAVGFCGKMNVDYGSISLECTSLDHSRVSSLSFSKLDDHSTLGVYLDAISTLAMRYFATLTFTELVVVLLEHIKLVHAYPRESWLVPAVVFIQIFKATLCEYGEIGATKFLVPRTYQDICQVITQALDNAQESRRNACLKVVLVGLETIALGAKTWSSKADVIPDLCLDSWLGVLRRCTSTFADAADAARLMAFVEQAYVELIFASAQDDQRIIKIELNLSRDLVQATEQVKIASLQILVDMWRNCTIHMAATAKNILPVTGELVDDESTRVQELSMHLEELVRSQLAS